MAVKDALLRHPRHPVPRFVVRALEEHGLVDACKERPAYQQNDYVGWINDARRPETKQQRLQQMLDELERGGIDMKMAHPPSRKSGK